MSLAGLNEQEREVLRQCLQAAVEDPFFSDWEFGMLFGLERDEVSRVLESWPGIDDTDKNVFVAINNAINNLLDYPAPNKCETWQTFIFCGRHGTRENLRQMERTGTLHVSEGARLF